jgi:hypothetical protein
MEYVALRSNGAEQRRSKQLAETMSLTNLDKKSSHLLEHQPAWRWVATK